MLEAVRLQNAARNSMEWFEHVKRYMHLEPQQFAYSLLTRSQRISHENLRTAGHALSRWCGAVGRQCIGSGSRGDGPKVHSLSALHVPGS